MLDTIRRYKVHKPLPQFPENPQRFKPHSAGRPRCFSQPARNTYLGMMVHLRFIPMQGCSQGLTKRCGYACGGNFCVQDVPGNLAYSKGGEMIDDWTEPHIDKYYV